jgi:hypothetical protein
MPQQPPPPPPNDAQGNHVFATKQVVAQALECWAAKPSIPKHQLEAMVVKLKQLPKPSLVKKLLLQTLAHPATLPDTLRATGELLCELYTLAQLQDPLWELIENPTLSDAAKDIANLVLRHLGDGADPEAYLAYLNDPEGLIQKETERMLSLSGDNPEALVDFMDFLLSLPDEDQLDLLRSLAGDVPPDLLAHLLLPLLATFPSPPVWERALTLLPVPVSGQGVTTLKNLLVALQSPQLKTHLGEEAVANLRKLTQKRLNKASGATKAPAAEPAPTLVPWQQRLTPVNAYTTLPDGLGNMPFILCWQWPNQDYAVVSLVLNDVEGITDCFGHFQLSQNEFDRLLALFYRELARIELPLPAAVEHTLDAAEANWLRGNALPHEFTCWQGLLEAFKPEDTTYWQPPCAAEVTPEVAVSLGEMTASLYQHPDFENWYLLQEAETQTPATPEEPTLSDVLYQELMTIAQLGELTQQRFYLDAFLVTFAQTVWQQYPLIVALLAQRLYVASVLLHYQGSPTFSKLAYAEALWLQQVQSNKLPLTLTAETLSQPRFVWHWLKTTLIEHLSALLPTDDDKDDDDDDDDDDKDTPDLDPAVIMALVNDTWARWRPQQKQAKPQAKVFKPLTLMAQPPSPQQEP